MLQPAQSANTRGSCPRSTVSLTSHRPPGPKCRTSPSVVVTSSSLASVTTASAWARVPLPIPSGFNVMPGSARRRDGALDANAGRPGTTVLKAVGTSTSSQRDPPSFVATVRVFLLPVHGNGLRRFREPTRCDPSLSGVRGSGGSRRTSRAAAPVRHERRLAGSQPGALRSGARNRIGGSHGRTSSRRVWDAAGAGRRIPLSCCVGAEDPSIACPTERSLLTASETRSGSHSEWSSDSAQNASACTRRHRRRVPPPGWVHERPV